MIDIKGPPVTQWRWTCAVEQHVVNVLSVASKTVTAAQLCSLQHEHSHHPKKEQAWLCSNKTLFTNTGNRLDMASSEFIVSPLDLSMLCLQHQFFPLSQRVEEGVVGPWCWEASPHTGLRLRFCGCPPLLAITSPVWVTRVRAGSEVTCSTAGVPHFLV